MSIFRWIRVPLQGLWVLLVASAVWAAESPWKIPTDVAEALRDPDRFAWRLFIALNWPANIAARSADPSAHFGDPSSVVWETWALAGDVYLPHGAAPPAWDGIITRAGKNRKTDRVPLQQSLINLVQPVPPGVAGHQKDEVRLNCGTFTYIRENELYSVEGQERFFYSGRTVNFPTDSMEIKAVWRIISDQDKARYHWAVIRDEEDGLERLYGLTTLHITSKVLPKWLWATFEHVDNPFRRGIHDEGWLLPSRDRVACSSEPYSCNRIPSGLGLEGTVWASYRLRGTQIDFTDALGRKVLLANSELETGFQRTASCMTCHSRSTIGPSVNAAASFEFGAGFTSHPLGSPQANRLPVFKQLKDGSFESYNGTPDPAWFQLPETGISDWHRYRQLDFVFSLIRAQNEADLPNQQK